MAVKIKVREECARWIICRRKHFDLNLLSMKKYIIIVLSLFLAMPSFCFSQEQDESPAKDYSTFLPTKGDIAISVGLNPIAFFAGNIFNGTIDNELDQFGGQPYFNADVRDLNFMPYNLVSISLKYMVTDKFATRLNFGYGYSKSGVNAYVIDDMALALDPFSQAKVVDSYRGVNHCGSVYLGGEYRMGNGRFQAVFSAGVNYYLGGIGKKISYGNAITDVNQSPTIASDSYKVTLPDRSGMINGRLLSSRQTVHGVGLTGGVGIEYFVAPKISIGAEVNLSLSAIFEITNNKIAEGYNVISGKPDVWVETQRPVNFYLNLATSNIGANFTFNYYISR